MTFSLSKSEVFYTRLESLKVSNHSGALETTDHCKVPLVSSYSAVSPNTSIPQQCGESVVAVSVAVHLDFTFSNKPSIPHPHLSTAVERAEILTCEAEA
jgi:hypothetical protein